MADVQDQVGGTPTQTEFNAFADAMSTTYGAPIEVFSVDPLTGAQTELDDTVVTNLLVEPAGLGSMCLIRSHGSAWRA